MLTHFSDIYRIASALERQKCPLTVHIDDNDESFRSQIVRADPDKKVLLIKPLVPSTGNPLLVRNQSCTLEAELDQLPAKLTGLSLHPQWSSEHKDLHALTFPSAVDYPQRRDCYRIEIPNYAQAIVHFVNGAQLLTGRLVDLSISGMGVVFELTGDKTEPLAVGNHYAAKIVIDSLLELDCHLLVKSGLYVNTRILRYGLSFESLNHIDERKIARTVLDLQKSSLTSRP